MAAYNDAGSDDFFLPQAPDDTRRRYPGGPVFELGAPGRKKVVSVKIEERLLEEIDDTWRALGYGSRSEFIREAVIYYMLVRRALAATNLCLCDCRENPNAKRIEDVLMEYAFQGDNHSQGAGLEDFSNENDTV